MKSNYNINLVYKRRIKNKDISLVRSKIQLFLSLRSNSKKTLKFLQNITVDLLISFPNEENNKYILGSTEHLDENKTNLTFDTTFYMEYIFEKHQYISLKIYSSEVLIDTIDTRLASIMGAKNQILEFKLNNTESEYDTFISIKGVSVRPESTNLLVKLDINANLLGAPYSDYFVLISNSIDGNKNNKVWKSCEVTGKEVNFKANDIFFNDLCAGDMEKEIFLEFYRYKQGLICEIKTTLKQIESKSSKQEFFVLNDSNNQPNQIGTCEINFSIERMIRFIEYVEKDLQVSLVVGIDFTSSNGNPNEDNSLHYIYGQEPNNYEQATRACGSIISNYTYDQKYPVYGFGAILRNSTFANHCFSLTFKNIPTVNGVDNIISTYKKALIEKRIELDGPTYFTPLIKNTIEYVKSNSSKSNHSIYYILLILTDGQIHDIKETKDAIVEASLLPISIIIIGIGNDDFHNMIDLDGDKVPLVTKKGEKIRDIVQFVCYNDFKMDSVKLSEEVLKEVPRQVEQYFRKYRNFKEFY